MGQWEHTFAVLKMTLHLQDGSAYTMLCLKTNHKNHLPYTGQTKLIIYSLTSSGQYNNKCSGTAFSGTQAVSLSKQA
jgi:hypothetical protein